MGNFFLKLGEVVAKNAVPFAIGTAVGVGATVGVGAALKHAKDKKATQISSETSSKK